MKILLISYPVSPYRGSEFAVAWNFITQMSKSSEIYVLYGTSGNGLGNVSELTDWLSENVIDCSQNFLWEKRVDIFEKSYNKVINNYVKK